MKQVVRVNTHPRPLNSDYEYHIPFLGNNYNQAKHVTQSYLSEFVKHVDPNSVVYLLGRGEPTSRHIMVKNFIKEQYHDVIIEPLNNGYTNPDPLFNDGYTTVPNSSTFNMVELVNQYLKYYPVLLKFSQRYTYKYHSRDHGYFSAGKRFWYQYGEDMPVAPSDEHKHLYKIFSQIFEQLVNILRPSMQLIGLTETMLRSKLMLRLSHNPPGARIDNLVVTRHVDNSIVTAWMYQNCPGAYIDHGQELEEQATPIENIYNNKKEILLIPGLDYCDQTGSATPATFHSVREIVVDHRVSLVAFIKY